MNTLVLIRHAKSSWAEQGQPDFDRPLAPRGISAAPVTGQWLASRGLDPDAVLLSPSARTKETWERLRPQLHRAPEPELVPAIYLAEPATLLTLLRGGSGQTLWIIGHEPGIPGLARLLAADPVPADCARAFAKFPTGGAAVLETEKAWAEAGPGTARFTAFFSPRDAE